MGLVFGVERVADGNGPGVRTVVLLKGCKLRCWWCHSPEGHRKQREVLFYPERCDACGACLEKCSSDALSFEGGAKQLDRRVCGACGLCLEACETGALQVSGEWLTAEEVMARVEADRAAVGAAYGGVTLSGGDVTLQPGFSRELLEACRARGIHTAIEVNGYAPWPVLLSLVELSDLVVYDLKHMDTAEHLRYTGVGNELILENLAATVATGANVQVSVPLIPGYTDTDENVRAILDHVVRLGIRQVKLVPFVESGREKYAALGRVYWLGHLRRQPAKRLEEIRQQALRRGLALEVVGESLTSARPA